MEMPAVSEIKLNLGSRNRGIDGFINLDCDPHDGVDIVDDVGDLSRFETDSVSEILASNILEHFPHPETLSVLKEWCRVLKKGGKLYLSVPDFRVALEAYDQFGLEDWVRNFLMGDQEYKTAFHYNIFDEDSLCKYVIMAGFSSFEKVESLPVSHPSDCSNNVLTLDGGKTGVMVSLNVVCAK